MTIRDKIRQTMRQYHLDQTDGKRPDLLLDKLEKLFLQELRARDRQYNDLSMQSHSVPASPEKTLATLSRHR